MSLEPITKKDIEKLFNKILRSQINRQKMNKIKGESNAEYKI